MTDGGFVEREQRLQIFWNASLGGLSASSYFGVICDGIRSGLCISRLQIGRGQNRSSGHRAFQVAAFALVKIGAKIGAAIGPDGQHRDIVKTVRCVDIIAAFRRPDPDLCGPRQEAVNPFRCALQRMNT